MRTATASRPGDPAKPNEDWYGVTPTCAVVLDGVSAPAGTDTGCHHGTPWFVAQLGARLLDLEARMPQLTPTDLLARAIGLVGLSHHGECDLTHPGSPAATVVMLRQRSDAFDYLVLSDSTLVLDLDDGPLVVSDPRADLAAPAERDAVFQHPVGSREHADSLIRMVEAQRRLRNKPGGYWVASAEPAAALHAQTGWVRARSFGSGLLVTDGVTRLQEWGVYDWEQLLAVAREHGPEYLIDVVRKVESANAPGGRRGRFKTSDDATAILVCADTPFNEG